MFKVPDWGDTPNNKLSFIKIQPKKKKPNGKKTKTSVTSKQIVQIKPRFKAKSKSRTKVINGTETIDKIQNCKETIKIFPAEKRPTSRELQAATASEPHKAVIVDSPSAAMRTKAKSLHTQVIRNIKKQENGSKDFIVRNKGSDDDIKIKNHDSDKLDELKLDVRKQKLDTYKKDDNEELLFQGNPNHINNSKNPITFNKNNKSVKKNGALIRNEKINLTKNIINTNSKDKITESTETGMNSTGSTDVNVIKKGVKSKNVRKKELIKSILNIERSSRNNLNVSGNQLRERMLDRLRAAKFRYLNEKLYTSTGSDAKGLFEADPAAFKVYHEGYQQQVKKWPVKPLDLIVKRIQKMSKTFKIADMGCGEAELSKRVVQPVRSFDLVATAPGVEACDMAHTPLLSKSMDVAVYCLALMGTDLTQYLLEANRVLKQGGHLLIAEVQSRCDDARRFASDVQRLGFSLKRLDDSQEVFFFMEFTKVSDPPAKKGKLPHLTLKPCIYKKR